MEAERIGRRALLVAAVAGGAAALAVGWHRAVRAQEAALSRIRRRGYLVAGVPLWLPPFGAPSRGGAWLGLDVTLARGVAAAVLGSPARAHLLPLTPGERRWAVRSGAADLVAAAVGANAPPGASAVPPAATGLHLVGPYFAEPLTLLVRRSDPLRAWGQLDGRVVALLPGGGAAEALRRAAGEAASFVSVEAASAAVVAHGLALGRYRAAVGGQAVCRALAGYDPELRVQPAALLGSQAYWVLLPPGGASLEAPVRQAIAALPSGSALRRLLAVWAAAAAEAPPDLLTGSPPTA